MSKDWFDQNMKNSLPEEGFDLDTNWKAIQVKRGKKKRRAFIFWYLLPALLIFVAAGILYTSSPSAVNSVSIPQYKSDPTQENITFQSNEIQKNSDRNSKETVYAEAKSPLNISSGNEILGQNKYQSVVTEKAKSPTIFQPKESKTTQAITSHNTDITLVNNNLYRVENINLNTVESTKISGSNSNELLNSMISLAALECRISYLPPRDYDLIIPSLDVVLHSDFKQAAKNNYWIGANVVYGLQTVKRTDDENLYAQRQEEEEPLDLIQAGFEFGWNFNKHLYIQTGLSFVQYTDRRRYESNQLYTVIDSNYIVSKLIRANGSMQDIYGVAEIPYVKNTKEIQYNRYRFMEIPVLLGLNFDLTPGFALRASAGVSVGLINSLSGSIAGPNELSIPLNQTDYKSNAQLAGQVRAEWIYQKPKWSAGVILQGRTDLSNQLKSEAGYREKRRAYSFGLVYRIHI